MLDKALITVLCGVGLYASLFMLGKARRAERGELEGPSVVERPQARLILGLPNALLGLWYYALLIVAAWLPLSHAVLFVPMAAVLFAAAMSLALAYSLLFITRRPCAYCWTSHAVNWLLVFFFIVRIWDARPLR